MEPNNHPQDANPEQPTRATDPQEAEISGNILEGLGKALRPSPEEAEQVRRDEPLEDTPQTSRD